MGFNNGKNKDDVQEQALAEANAAAEAEMKQMQQRAYTESDEERISRLADERAAKIVEQRIRAQEQQKQNQPPASTYSLEQFDNGVYDLADETVEKIIELLTQWKDKMSADKKQLKENILFAGLSRNKTDSFASVVIAVRRVLAGKICIGFQTYLIESSIPPIDARIIETATGRNEVYVPVSRAYTPEYIQKASQIAKTVFVAKPDAMVFDCGCQIIARETEIKDITSLTPFLSETLRSINAAIDSRNPQIERFNLVKLRESQRYVLESNTRIGGSFVRPNGIPVRSDIITQINSSNQQSKDQPHKVNEQRNLSTTNSYVELKYAPLNGNHGNIQSYYVPRIVTTQLTSSLGGSPLEFALLGLASVCVLSRNRGYGIAFRDNGYSQTGGTFLRDLGAVGYQIPLRDVPPGTAVDVAGSDGDLRRLIEETIAPNVVYSIEIEQGSMNNWLMQVFAAASLNTHQGVAARRRIITAANNLTNNLFGQMYGQRQNVQALEDIPMIRSTNDENLVGYYSSNGERRPLSELDLLAILNLQGNKDKELVNQYISTLAASSGVDPITRLNRRLSIIRSIASDVVVKGYSEKYDFSAAFIESLISAVMATGISVGNNNVGLRDGIYNQGSYGDWESVLTNPNLANNLFVGQQSNGGNYSQYTGMNFSQNWGNQYY